MNKQHRRENGAVSIFIVIFTALLVTVVTTGFIQIMLRNQNQATNNDLSQSAYDSALAGVEDAKRALVRMKKCEKDGDACAGTIYNALKTKDCQSLGMDGGAGVVTFNSDGEVPVGSGLNQAYTCVKVSTETDYIEGSLSDQEVAVKALRGTDDTSFNAIRVSWFQQSDAPAQATPVYDINPVELPPHESWPETQPPIMRAQFIQTGKNNINLNEFNINRDGSDARNSARTLFLYPSTGGLDTHDFDDDDRRSRETRNVPKPAECFSDYTNGYAGFACSVKISLPESFNSSNMNGYIQLKPIYVKESSSVSYRVNLLEDADNEEIVPFDGVQPQVDSTGRASDLFRRAQASISVSEGGSQLPFPDAALIVRGNLCKDFFVTNNNNHYVRGDCEPGITSSEP